MDDNKLKICQRLLYTRASMHPIRPTVCYESDGVDGTTEEEANETIEGKTYTHSAQPHKRVMLEG